VRNLRGEIGARGSGDFSPVPVAGLPSEIGPIAEAVNHLLNRLRRALEAERSFTANAAHELRTPIAAALAQTQRLIAETKDTAARERSKQIEAALQRLSRLAEKLMQLARAEGGRLRSAEASDIRPVVKLVVDEIIRTSDAAGRVDLALPDAPILSDIDPDALAIAARNLIDNALRHGAPGGLVAVTLSLAGELTVSNDGSPVPPDVLERLSQPFERGQTIADGSGLGLAIARAIASGVGGKLVLSSPRPGREGGFEARLSLPL